MAIDVRIPARDAPRGWSVALVAAAALSVGVLVAWWGTDREARDAEATDVAVEARIEATAADSPDLSAASSDAGLLPDSGVIAEPPSEASAETGFEPAAVLEPVAELEPESDAESASPPVEPAPSLELRVRQGRVAYIRCDGVSDCPRDEGMEEAVWAIVETLPTCPTGPRQPGEADIRLDYPATGQPEVAWRDTFPSSTVRLEREAVLGCIRARLAGTRQSLGAERLLVSFRFAME